MNTKTRMDVIAKQFERGLQSAGCSGSNIAQIVGLIRQKKISAVSFLASEESFKVYELIFSIDWNEYDRQNAGKPFQAESIIGLQPSGEAIEVETHLDDLVKKSREKQLRLSYGISFAGALRIRDPEEYYRLKKQLGFEDNLLGWMNDLGRDQVDEILDLPEFKIRLRDIKDVDAQDSSRLRAKKTLLLKCELAAEQLSDSEGDYNINRLVFPIEVSLTFQGQKKAARLLGITSLNEPAYAELKQGVISALVRKEERRIEEHRGDKPQEPAVKPNGNGNKPQDHAAKPNGNADKPRNHHNSSPGKGSGTGQGNSERDDVSLLPAKIPLVFNLIAAAVLIAVLCYNKLDLSATPWLIILLPVGIWWGYGFVGDVLLEKYDGLKKYDRALWIVLFFVCLVSLLPRILSYIGKEVLFLYHLQSIIAHLYVVPVLALSTASCLEYLTAKGSRDKRIPLLKTLSIILCSVLAVLLVIGTVNQIEALHPETANQPEEVPPLSAGDTVLFGTYEQDGDLSNGSEDIGWTVIDVDDRKALLLADACLDALPYNSEGTDNSWTNSTLRKWLNSDFYQSAFSASERSMIRSEEITTGRVYSQEGNTFTETFDEAEVTIDKVFAPELSEFRKLKSELNLSNVAKEAFSAHNTVYGGENFRSMFWTRPPYEEENNFGYGYVTETEKNMGYALRPDSYALVRPALYIDVEMYSDLQHTPKDPDN